MQSVVSTYIYYKNGDIVIKESHKEETLLGNIMAYIEYEADKEEKHKIRHIDKITVKSKEALYGTCDVEDVYIDGAFIPDNERSEFKLNASYRLVDLPERVTDYTIEAVIRELKTGYHHTSLVHFDVTDTNMPKDIYIAITAHGLYENELHFKTTQDIVDGTVKYTVLAVETALSRSKTKLLLDVTIPQDIPKELVDLFVIL